VIAVADSFEAVTSDRLIVRRYRSISHSILLEGRGKQWDPNIVNAFVDLVMIQVDEKSTEALSESQAASASSQTILTSPKVHWGL
jgi:HD-GYP domain-containing protein (c-di-GMP phosphodiesterase class II)